MQSTRLPGKVLKEVLGKPLLTYLIERLNRSRWINQLVIATSIEVADDVIADYCQQHHIEVYRGSEKDVLSRYFEAAHAFAADLVVRICADSPLIDPALVDELLEEYLLEGSNWDYFSNTIKQSCPFGMNTEVFTFAALAKAHSEANQRYEREHVTPYLYRHPELFSVHEKHYEPDRSNIRLTVDTPEDFVLIEQIIKGVVPITVDFDLPDILKFLERNPDLLKINENVQPTPSEE